MNFRNLAKAIELVAVLGALAFGAVVAVHGHFDTASYYLPTFDNAMLWAGRARIILETGHYPEMELVFGGVTKTYHVPFWPSMTAGFSALSGLDFYWTIRLMSILQTILLGLMVYLVAKRLTGSRPAAALAIILAYNSINLMSWGTRNSPGSWGVLLIPFGLWALAERDAWLAVLAGVALALDHQPSLLIYVLSLLLYVIASNLGKVQAVLKTRSINGIELAPILAGLAAFATYMVWHVRQTGLSCLNFKCLPQLGAKEFGKNSGMLQYFSAFPQVVGAIGVAGAALWMLRKEENLKKWAAVAAVVLFAAGSFSAVPALEFVAVALLLYAACRTHEPLILLSWLAAGFILSNNDVLGLGVFTQRFLTQFDQAVAVAGGSLLAVAAEMISEMAPRAAKNRGR